MTRRSTRVCGVATMIAMLVICATKAMSQGNSVVVESKSVLPGQTGVTVGVYISNAVDISAIVLPFEFRTVGSASGPHAFTQGPVMRYWNPGGRGDTSALGPNSVWGFPATIVSRWYPSTGGTICSGPISGSYGAPNNTPDNLSPDGSLFTAFGMGCGEACDDYASWVMFAGQEVPGLNDPSFLLQFDVNAVEGGFEIDTCCVSPANHLYFIDRNTAIVPGVEFTKGVITVGTPPENSVVVESKKVLPGATNVEVGVFVSNTVPLYALLIPLEFRTVSGGAFTSGQTLGLFSQSGRISQLYCTLGGCPGEPCEGTLLRRYASPTSQSCSGPLSSSYSLPSASLDGLSPDGFLFGVIGCDTGWLPPEQEIPGEDVASFQFRFDVAAQAGEFEIDTCCVMPANHLFFQEHYLSAPFTPWFTKGRIHVGCFCECHGDPDCNGYLDIVDVVRTVNTAFRGLPSITDQDCTHARTDVDANAMTNVLDVARMIDVVFGGESQQDVFVDPCAE